MYRNTISTARDRTKGHVSSKQKEGIFFFLSGVTQAIRKTPMFLLRGTNILDSPQTYGTS